MGDAGALFLGIIVSVLTIRLDPGIDSRSKSLAIPLAPGWRSQLWIQLRQSALAFFVAFRPSKGGRDHLSHRLLAWDLERQGAAFFFRSLAGAYGALASRFTPGKILGLSTYGSWRS